MPRHPFMSVILPVYNGQDYLPAAMDTLCGQAEPAELDVIAVDDGSSDRTVEILKSYRNRLPLRIVEQAHAGNWVAGVNRGLAQAVGEFVSILHQDDLWAPDRLAVLKAASRLLGDVDVFLAPSRFIDRHGRALGLWSCPLPHHGRALLPEQWFLPLLVQSYISMPAPMVRRAALSPMPPMDEAVRYTADWKLWLTLATRCRAAYVPRPLTSFRIHPVSQTVQFARNLPDYRHQMESVVSAFFPHLAARADRERWKRLALYSVNVNVALAARAQGDRASLLPLLRQGLRGGVRDFLLYLKCSRIRERVVARLRAGLAVRRR